MRTKRCTGVRQARNDDNKEKKPNISDCQRWRPWAPGELDRLLRRVWAGSRPIPTSDVDPRQDAPTAPSIDR